MRTVDVAMPPPTLSTVTGRDNDYYYCKDNSPAFSFKEEEERRRHNRGRGLHDSVLWHDDDKQGPLPVATVVVKIVIDDVDTVIIVDSMTTTTNTTIATSNDNSSRSTHQSSCLSSIQIYLSTEFAPHDTISYMN